MCICKLISEKEFKYFTYSFKKATKLSNSVPGRPVTWNCGIPTENCGTPTEKASEYLDHILKPAMQENWSYIKDSGYFLKKVKHLGQIPNGAILVTADAVGPYSSIPYKAGLAILRRKLSEHGSICS